GDRKAAVTTGDDGRWSVALEPMQANSRPVTLRVEGTNVVEVEDVLIGEVWLCSGQSNMEWTVSNSLNREAEIAAAKHPLIRHVKIARRASTVPLDDVQAEWQVCSPQVVANFTAVGYYMAKQLQTELDVPIGLVNSSWGGTRVEPWTPTIGFREVPMLQDIYQSVIGRTPGSPAYQTRLGDYLTKNEQWTVAAKSALSSHEPLDPSPAYPDSLKPFTSHQDPTMLYNGMIHALVGFPIRGEIWYQGESNHADGMLYFEKKKALIQGWRTLWDQGEFPFYYVQIAPFQYGNEDPAILARFWEAQSAVQQLPNTGMVVINDIATVNNIHPPNKQDVGSRLALLALKNEYGRDDLVANSPKVESVSPDGKQLKITFDNTAGGLKTRDGQPPTYFEVIGPGTRSYVSATAEIEGDSVVLTSADVDEPTAFRFAWDKLAEPNLTGGTGLPVGACRGGDEPDFLRLLNIEKDYQLVYDLDLSKLQAELQYDVDRSRQVEPFDRIGYLVELKSKDQGEQKLFVSMQAFTDDAGKIGIPVASSDAMFQQVVSDMDIFSTDPTLNALGRSGNVEFWPHNYAPNNGAEVAGASPSKFDFGDQPGEPQDGYGSMQVHEPNAKTTLFSISHWGAGQKADLGIGNGDKMGQHPDWTFAGNAEDYSAKRLRVYVRPVERGDSN
ncbi:MAG: sialate O-acetylesterase, partial [Rubripirellula sp.]